MISFISTLVAISFTSAVSFYIVYKLNRGSKDNVKRYLLAIPISTLMLVINNYNPISILKPFIAVFSLIILSRYFIKLDSLSSFLTAIYFELMCIISEVISAEIFMLILKERVDLIEWYSSPSGVLILNFVISLLLFLAIKLKFVKNIYDIFYKFMESISRKVTLVVMLASFAVAVILFYVVYYCYYTNQLVVYITIVVLFILYAIFISTILRDKVRYANIESKYSLSLSNLSEYEQMINQYRIATHENKNQLLLIRNMVKDKKVLNYIDELIDNKSEDCSTYDILKRIPLSSIRSVIYSKVLLMNNKGIKYDINIERKISSSDFSNIPDSVALEICNILNVFLDNAIEEEMDYSNKEILIEFDKVDGEIVIAISNICNKNIDLSMLSNMGYSTKGDGHGYGLTLVKNSINKYSSYLRNTTELENNVFTQYLYIKGKKKM